MIDLTTISTLTTNELNNLIAAVKAALAARETTPVAKRVTIHYCLYNPRRMSRPWIAKITSWPVGGRPELQFGSYLGNDNGGDLEIMALPGDILRDGQKDRRGNNGTNDWSVVEADYTLRTIDQAEARKLFCL
jgi:hypothetical protein